MHDHLASLCGGAGEACTQHEGVETHLEQLDQVLTGQAVLTLCLFEGDDELLLADAVLGAKTLLLAQTNGVVAVALTLGAAVLAGAVGALLEVACGLRGQGNAQGARLAHLGAGTGGLRQLVFLSGFCVFMGEDRSAFALPARCSLGHTKSALIATDAAQRTRLGAPKLGEEPASVRERPLQKPGYRAPAMCFPLAASCGMPCWPKKILSDLVTLG